jgi:hypothetical protein
MLPVGTLWTGYPYAQDLSQVLRHQTLHPAREGSGVATCPVTPGPSPGEGGLWCHHVSHSFRPTSRCGRALASWQVPWHRTHLPTGEGSSVATRPMPPGPPPFDRGGLRCRHGSHGCRPASLCRRALASPRATWL